MNFSKFQFGQNTGLRQENRDEEEFVNHQNKKVKYHTTNYFQDIKPNHNGFGTPSQEVESSTSLRGSITNPRVKQDWKPLQLNPGGLAQSGPTIDHYNVRDRRTCLPTEDQFQNRSFYTLDKNPNQVQQSSAYRQGLNTRYD